MESLLRLQVQNSLEYLIVDEAHWELVKDVRWVLGKDGMIRSKSGVSYDEFVGIEAGQKNMLDNPFDKRVKFLIDDHLEYRWSEYYGRFELRVKR